MNLRKSCFTLLTVLLVICSLLISTSSLLAQEPVTVTFWHAMSGSRLGVLESIIEDFNSSQTEYKVEPLFTGSYAETLTKYVAAYPTGTAPVSYTHLTLPTKRIV